jgi:hypothetical protein
LKPSLFVLYRKTNEKGVEPMLDTLCLPLSFKKEGNEKVEKMGE